MNLINKSRLSFLLVFIVLALCAVVTACTDEQALAEIDKLKTENEMLRYQADSLENTLKALNAHGDSVRKSLESLDMGL